MISVDEIADLLLAAESNVAELEPFTDSDAQFDLVSAYTAQRELIGKHIKNGEAIVGAKLGLTSVAKQQQMGIDSPIIGYLTDRMRLAEGEQLPFDRLIHPKCEPEIAFVMSTGLEGPDVTPDDAMAAVATVHAAIEVIDSRYRDFRFKLPDVVADNASSSRFVIASEALDPRSLAWDTEHCDLTINGHLYASATGAAVQGHPGIALAAAVNDMALRGEHIEAGWIVLTGGLTDAVRISQGDTVTARFTHLGSIAVA